MVMKQRLMRVWYVTDAEEGSDPQYQGAFSQPFPAETDSRRIIAVNWDHEVGLVEVTWLVSAE